MKKIIILLAATLVAAGAYAQTQRTNRTKVRTHDRSETVSGENKPVQDIKNQPDRMRLQTDMDRNNTNNNTNGTNSNRPATTTNPNGTNTNGGNGTNGANINTNNPK